MPLLSTHAPHAHGLGLAGALATRVEAYNQPALAAGHVVYRGGYELHRPVRVGGQNHSNSPHRHLQATSADLGRFFCWWGGFLGAGFWAKWADSESGSHRRNPASAHNRWSKSLRIHRYLTFISAVGSAIIFHSLNSNDRLSRVVIDATLARRSLDIRLYRSKRGLP